MGQRGRKCWQTDFIRTDGEVCPAGSLNSAYNIILFRVGWGRKASSCTELKRTQSAKCRVPHFSLPPILPLFWVAIFMYYAVHFLYNPSGKWETIRWTRQKLVQPISYCGTPLILSPMGQKNLAILTRVFYKKMYGDFGQATKKKWP